MEDIKQNNINLRANNYHPKSEKEKINPKKNKTGKNLFLNEELPQNSILFNVNYKPDIIINHQTSNNFRTNINLQPCPSYSKTEYNQKNYSSQNQYYTIDASNNNFNKRNRVEESPILNNGFIHDKIEILTKVFKLREDNLNKDKNMNYINYNDLSQKDKNSINNRIDYHTKNNNNIIKNINPSSQKDSKNKKYIEERNINRNNLNNIKYMTNNGESNPKYDLSDNLKNLSRYKNNKANNKNKNSNDLEYFELMKNIFKKKNKIKSDFSPSKILNNIIERKVNSNINGYNIYNINFNYYKIRAIKKIFKFINKFYKKCLKQYFNYFLYIINSNKIINKYDDEICNNKVITDHKSYISDDVKNTYDKLPIKSKLYKTINNRKINRTNFKSVFNNLASKRNYTRDLTPFLKVGNETILLNDISFKTEDSKADPELYRDSYELNKKYQQILIRKRRSKLKNNNLNRTFDKKNEKDSHSNIRNYIKLTDNSMQDNSVTTTKTLNSIKNNNRIYQNLIRIKKLDNNHKKNSNRFRNNKSYDKEAKILKNKNKLNKISKNKIYNRNQDGLTKNHNHNNIKNYAFTVLIKNICTKDGRINIYINYYFLLRNNSPLITRYNNLKLSNYFSITYIINNKNNLKLSSIIEEQSQNPYFYYDKNKNCNNDKININKINKQ